jgi:hypothetical protein
VLALRAGLEDCAPASREPDLLAGGGRGLGLGVSSLPSVVLLGETAGDPFARTAPAPPPPLAPGA